MKAFMKVNNIFLVFISYSLCLFIECSYVKRKLYDIVHIFSK